MGESSGGAEEDAARAAGRTITRSDAEEAATELGVILDAEEAAATELGVIDAEEAAATELGVILSGRAQVCAGSPKLHSLWESRARSFLSYLRIPQVAHTTAEAVHDTVQPEIQQRGKRKATPQNVGLL